MLRLWVVPALTLTFAALAPAQYGGGNGSGRGMGRDRTAQWGGMDAENRQPDFPPAPRAGRRGAGDRSSRGPIRMRGPAQSATVSLADLKAPKKAQKAYEKAREQLAARRFDKAGTFLRQAIEIYPTYPSALESLGWLLARQRKFDEAYETYRAAVGADPKAGRAWAGLAEIAMMRQDWTDLAESSARAIQSSAFVNSRLWVYNAMANYSLGRYDLAERSAEEAIERGGRLSGKAFHVLGLIQALHGDFDQAIVNLRRYLVAFPEAPDKDKVQRQVAYFEAEAAARTMTPPPGE